MPRVVFFREASGSVPLLEWQDGLSRRARAYAYASMDRLRLLGHELRRPEADYLAEGIYELRFRCDRLNYRLLYFFHGREVVVISHGFIKKEARVPDRELHIARRRKIAFMANPARHTHEDL